MKQLTPEEELEAARNLEPEDCDIAAVGGARRCSSCGRPGGGHEIDCQHARRLERVKLQAECDHRSETVTRTTGDPPGLPCCGRCGLELPEPQKPPPFDRELTAQPSRVSTDHFQRSVTCAWCGNRYRSACPGDLDRGLQGSHCASDVVQKDGEWFVRGGYGSDEHDMHRYLFVANPPAAPADPVCDECISERLQAGDLRDTGLECDRRPADFGSRPFGTWGLVYQIRELVESTVVMRRLVDAACKEHDKAHPSDENDPSRPCEVCAEIREYRKHQRWSGELEDGGEEYVRGCPEVAGQMREAARRLEELSAFWERQRPDNDPSEGL